jgi:hypothetical protein
MIWVEVLVKNGYDKEIRRTRTAVISTMVTVS